MQALRADEKCFFFTMRYPAGTGCNKQLNALWKFKKFKVLQVWYKQVIMVQELYNIHTYTYETGYSPFFLIFTIRINF